MCETTFPRTSLPKHIFRKADYKLVPEFRVLCAEPSGGLDFSNTHLSILVLHSVPNPEGRFTAVSGTSNRHDDLWVELLTMTAYYHSTESLEFRPPFVGRCKL